MKPSAPDSSLAITAVLPPVLAERIRRHYDLLYGEGFTASDAFAQFWSEFTTDARFRDRVQTKGRELQLIVFDTQDPSWGLWPIDPEECRNRFFARFIARGVDRRVFGKFARTESCPSRGGGCRFW